MVCPEDFSFSWDPALCVENLKVGRGNPFCDCLEQQWAVIPPDAYLVGSPEEIYGAQVDGPDFDPNKYIDHPAIIAPFDIDPVKISSWREALIWRKAMHIRLDMIEATVEEISKWYPESHHSIILEKCAELKKYSQNAEHKVLKALAEFHINHPMAFFRPVTVASLCQDQRG